MNEEHIEDLYDLIDKLRQELAGALQELESAKEKLLTYPTVVLILLDYHSGAVLALETF